MRAMTRIPLSDQTLPPENASRGQPSSGSAAHRLDAAALAALADDIRAWGSELGFQQVGISDTDLGEHPAHLARWLEAGHHAGMEWLREPKRIDPAALKPGTVRILSLRMDYLPADPRIHEILGDPDRAYLARYALGRDYHKIIRPRLQRLADRIAEAIGPFGYRAYVDSAPVMEKAVASQAGLGWMGKHTVIINRQAGSWFFLGELFTDLPLPVDAPVSNHCGSCQACIDICPTQAIVAPYVLDAGKCISYLTIEYRGVIPLALRQPIGNRIFGCDDCQLVCPWNRYARAASEPGLTPRQAFDGPALLDLWRWDEATWLAQTAGMALRRLDYPTWLRNLSVALANAPGSPDILAALVERMAGLLASNRLDAVLREHLHWAIATQREKLQITPRRSPAS